MTLSQYFEQRDTPMPGSPVGKTMAGILEKYPEWTFQQARAEANLISARPEFARPLERTRG